MKDLAIRIAKANHVSGMLLGRRDVLQLWKRIGHVYYQQVMEDGQPAKRVIENVEFLSLAGGLFVCKSCRNKG